MKDNEVCMSPFKMGFVETLAENSVSRYCGRERLGAIEPAYGAM